MCNFCVGILQAQDYSQLYYHDPTKNFVYTDAVVTEKFHATNTFNFDGTILFQPLEDGTTKAMQVTLTDNAGAVVNTRTYTLPTAIDMIPNAAAYNSNIQTYIVTGVCRSYSNNNIHSTWYMLLDQDLTFITAKQFDLISTFPFTSSPPTSSDQSTFVTDVCPVLYKTGVDFAMTGMVLNNDIDPDVALANPADRMLFIVELDAGTPMIANYMKYNVTALLGQNFTRSCFPSRIVEIDNINNSNPGYLIAGTTRLATSTTAEAGFYLRTDAALSNPEFRQFQQNAPGLGYGIFAIGDLFYDNTNQELYVAGTISFDNGTGDGLFLFDKLNNLTTGINTDSYLSGAWSNALGVYRLPFNDLNGWPKVGRISPPNSGVSTLTGVLYRNNPGMWTNTPKIPLVMQVDYSNTGLNAFGSLGVHPIDIYPRIVGWTNGPVAYYNAHSLSSPWYPNHTSFQFNAASDMYSLAGMSDDPGGNAGDYLCVSMTQNVNVNSCNNFQQNAVDELVPVTTFTVTPGTEQNTKSEMTLTLGFPNWATPTSNDCISQLTFKNNPLSDRGNSGFWYHENILFSPTDLKQEVRFELYTIAGNVILRGNLNHLEPRFLIPDLPDGVYIFKLKTRSGYEVVKYVR